jgi:GNAT superfamily N-acetyltransferase
LEEEYENQQSWRTSHDKLTFIVCKPVGEHKTSPKQVQAGQPDSSEMMLGDVNFFVHRVDKDEEEGEDQAVPSSSKENRCKVEIDVMIANESSRGKGIGHAVVTAGLVYLYRNRDKIMKEYSDVEAQKASNSREGTSRVLEANQPVHLKEVIARIGEANEKSIALFKRVGFKQRGEISYWREYELILEDFCTAMEDGRLEWSSQAAQDYTELEYTHP